MIESVEAAWSEVPRLFTLSMFFAELDLGVPRVSVSVCQH